MAEQTTPGSPVDEAEILQPLVARYLSGSRLSPATRGQVLHIARGEPAWHVVTSTGLTYHAVRCRRARLYRTLEVEGAAQIVSGLLAISLELLAGRDRGTRALA
jgi:hypothetical protein